MVHLVAVYYILEVSIVTGQDQSVVDVLEAKVRRAAETGKPFIPVRELFI